jgi:cell pole-organizing protein PopZ
MEEILASIRRIIADDDAKPPAAPPKAAAPPAAAKNGQDDIDAMLAGFDVAETDGPEAAAPDVLELTESMQAKAPAFNPIEGPPDVVFSEPEPEPAPLPEAPEPAPPPADRPLLSPRTSAAVDMAFNSLAHTVLVQNSRTLDDLVREMLKPMLKAWLDDNLPNMVERMVRAEIERVSRGRG